VVSSSYDILELLKSSHVPWPVIIVTGVNR
jgi:hypothetical protein